MGGSWGLLLMNNWHHKWNIWSLSGYSWLAGWSDVTLPGPSKKLMLASPQVILTSGCSVHSHLFTGQWPEVSLSLSCLLCQQFLLCACCWRMDGRQSRGGKIKFRPQAGKSDEPLPANWDVQDVGCLGSKRKFLNFDWKWSQILE